MTMRISKRNNPTRPAATKVQVAYRGHSADVAINQRHSNPGVQTVGYLGISINTLLEAQVRKNFRRRFWVETGLASIAGLLALITPIFPDWIEFVSGWDPDQRDGSVEWLIVVGLFLVTVVMFALTATEWRRTPVESLA
jgi:hypothetical protein